MLNARNQVWDYVTYFFIYCKERSQMTKLTETFLNKLLFHCQFCDYVGSENEPVQ